MVDNKAEQTPDGIYTTTCSKSSMFKFLFWIAWKHGKLVNVPNRIDRFQRAKNVTFCTCVCRTQTCNFKTKKYWSLEREFLFVYYSGTLKFGNSFDNCMSCIRPNIIVTALWCTNWERNMNWVNGTSNKQRKKGDQKDEFSLSNNRLTSDPVGSRRRRTTI